MMVGIVMVITLTRPLYHPRAGRTFPKPYLEARENLYNK